MEFEAIIHPFTPGFEGTCIFPVDSTQDNIPRMTACGRDRGFHVDIVKVSATGEILQGHNRVEAARTLGLPLLYEVVSK